MLTEQQQPIHQVQCGDCRRWPINGWAYRCGQCTVTLCAACIQFTPHDPDHAFVLLKRPMDPRHHHCDKLLSVAPYGTTDTTRADKSQPQPVRLNFSQSGSSTVSLCNSDTQAPTLEHKKGPLFDRLVSEMAPESPFQRTPPSDQALRVDAEQDARCDPLKPVFPFPFGLERRQPTGFSKFT